MTTNLNALTPLAKQVLRSRAAGTPIIAVETPDQGACITQLMEVPLFDDNGAPVEPTFLRWDAASGLFGLNAAGQKWLTKALRPKPAAPGDPMMAMPPRQEDSLDIHVALRWLDDLPEYGCAFIVNAPRIWGDLPAVQAIANKRDAYKLNLRQLVLLGPACILPVELAQDVLIYREEYPDDSIVRHIVEQAWANSAAGNPTFQTPSAETTTRVVAACAGLSAFVAEQSVAVATDASGCDVETVWQRKIAAIEQTKGLSVRRTRRTLDDVKGLAGLKSLLTALTDVRVVVQIDEIDKVMQNRNDLNGLGADALAQLLQHMEDSKALGIVAVGGPGTGKTMLAEAAGARFGALTIMFDVNGMQGSLVGESQAAVRTGLGVIKACGRGKELWIATCNRLDSVPPELLRRFRLGVWYFELPTAAEKATIWPFYCTEFGVDATQARPDDTDWTGAEIRTCCELAARLHLPLVAAAEYLIPTAVAAPQAIEALRQQAEGRWRSATTGRPYQREDATPAAPAPTVVGQRKMRMN